ncbi:MobA/MobL family protein [Mariprofundus ferrooxydans]|uniref:MobA/MobL family protein n=1 Tax=Mariprofundus ferrooxydans TaxID=314344 RepID=UPI00039BF728|nr:MobA/MobL family protein [Mariprofundus ferrooxydans]
MYHFDVRIGYKGKAAPHFHYIAAIGKYAAKCGVVHVEHGNMPLWAAANPSLYWEASDTYERANGTSYWEIEVALPRELPLPIQLNLARQLASEVCGKKHAFSFAIHHAKASDGGLNPHVHLEFSERIQDGTERSISTFFKKADHRVPERGGCRKDRSWQAVTRGRQKCGAEASDRLLEIREKWAHMCNKALEEFGTETRVDHRSYADQGVDRVPQPKVGASSWHLYRRTGIKNVRYQRYEQVINANQLQARIVQLEASSERLETQHQLIHDQLNQLKKQRPLIRSLNDVISELLPQTVSGKARLRDIGLARDNLKAARQRHERYSQITNSPLKWRNIMEKLRCFWEHGTEEGEQMLVDEAEQALEQAQASYDSLFEIAKTHSNLVARANQIIKTEIQAHRAWQQELNSLHQSLNDINDELEPINVELDQLSPVIEALPFRPTLH